MENVHGRTGVCGRGRGGWGGGCEVAGEGLKWPNLSESTFWMSPYTGIKLQKTIFHTGA